MICLAKRDEIANSMCLIISAKSCSRLSIFIRQCTIKFIIRFLKIFPLFLTTVYIYVNVSISWSPYYLSLCDVSTLNLSFFS